MTADELLDLPDDGMRHELVAGRLTAVSPPGADHGVVSLEIAARLREHARATGAGVALGEIGFLVERNPDTVRAPDAAFIAKERYEALGPTSNYWPEPPAFAAEVVSPNDSFGEVEAKAFEWLDAGTSAVLVVDPKRRTATVYRARDDVRAYRADDEVDVGDAVPGWRFTLSQLFA
jgi:Uma2 family endonuclease